MIMQQLFLAGLTGICLLAASGCQIRSHFPNENTSRTTLLINNGWAFHKGEQPGAEAADFNDSGWDRVGLPHSASIPYWVDMVEVYEGDVWYRKEFAAEASSKGRHAFVEFEGAFQHAWVYLNGKLLGEHKGGYTGFSYDMTPALNYDARNVLAVRVRNGWDAQVAPRAGDSIFPNGIRNVRFVITSPQHVEWCGQYIATPQVSEGSASVRINTEVKNEDAAEAGCVVLVEVLDAAGKVVTHARSQVVLAPGKATVVAQDLPPIASPHLWSPENPYLYQVRTRLSNEQGVLDEYRETLGIRWFKFTENEGFFLNGKHVYLTGFNVHEDRAGWAFAGTDAAMRRDMEIMKQAGANCIRASHNPHPRAFYQACDELGLLVWDELHFWGRGGFKGGEDGSYMAEAYPTVESDRPEFDRNLKDNLRDMIKEHRNHPCVIAWSLGNETVMQMKEPLLSETRRMFIELNDLAHQMDPTRPTGMGNVFFTGKESIADIAGFNGGQPKEKVGGKPILTTEFKPQRPPLADAWRSGALAWSGFAYGTHCVNKRTGKSFGLDFGLFDYHRLLKKGSASLIPTSFKEPVEGTPAQLALAADKTTLRNDGTDDTQLIIRVLDRDGRLIANDVPVALVIVSGAGQLPTGRSWTTSTSNMGRQAIEFRCYQPGKTVLEVTSPGLKPARVEITTLGTATDKVTLK